jgi:hypothetical protein
MIEMPVMLEKKSTPASTPKHNPNKSTNNTNSNSNARYLPPSNGRMSLEVKDGFAKKDVYRVLTTCDEANLNKLASNVGGSAVTIVSEIRVEAERKQSGRE